MLYFSEPAAYSHPGQVQAVPDQVGRDFASLWHLMKQYPGLENSSLVGPDEVEVTGGLGGEIIQQYVLKISTVRNI